MSNTEIENELRLAMVEETSALGVPPGLAHRVVRGVDRGGGLVRRPWPWSPRPCWRRPYPAT